MIRLEKYHNGPKAKAMFSASEMDRRQAMVRQWMVENDVDVVVFNSIHNINYFSGFVYCAFGRN
jgi:Creatinase/Prolidase N-terminal domain.